MINPFSRNDLSLMKRVQIGSKEWAKKHRLDIKSIERCIACNGHIFHNGKKIHSFYPVENETYVGFEIKCTVNCGYILHTEYRSKIKRFKLYIIRKFHHLYYWHLIKFKNWITFKEFRKELIDFYKNLQEFNKNMRRVK